MNYAKGGCVIGFAARPGEGTGLAGRKEPPLHPPPPTPPHSLSLPGTTPKVARAGQGEAGMFYQPLNHRLINDHRRLV